MYESKYGTNKPSRVSVSQMYVLYSCNYDNKMILTWLEKKNIYIYIMPCELCKIISYSESESRFHWKGNSQCKIDWWFVPFRTAHSCRRCIILFTMDILTDTQTGWLRMYREFRERFPRYRLQRKLRVSDPGMHHVTCVTHVPWCISGSPTGGGGENVPGIPGACVTSNFTYLARGPCNGSR